MAAVAAEHDAMVALLAELVAAPTPLGEEARGKDVMRRAFAAAGLEPVDVPLDAAALDAHAGDAPEGANAIEASYAVIEALRALEAELNAEKPPLYAAHPHPINLNVGVIRGGDWPSTVAGECVTHFRLATYPGQPVAALRERVEAAVAEVALPGLRVEVVY